MFDASPWCGAVVAASIPVAAVKETGRYMQACWNVVKCSSSACFLFRGRRMFLRTHVCVATQRTDVPALEMLFGVQLLLHRGATTPSSQEHSKSENRTGRVCRVL